jgi:hypothetical protein
LTITSGFSARLEWPSSNARAIGPPRARSWAPSSVAVTIQACVCASSATISPVSSVDPVSTTTQAAGRLLLARERVRDAADVRRLVADGW